MLSYDKSGKPLKTKTATELAVHKAGAKHKLGLDAAAIRADLLKEKQPGFTSTRTFIALRERFAASQGKAAPFAIIPDIALNSPKITSNFTTRRFAESVNKRYQACMKLR